MNDSSFVFRVFNIQVIRSPQAVVWFWLLKNRELAGEIRLDLEAGGHTVQIAETLAEGLRAARLGDVAALVIDRMLHFEDGNEDGLSIIETLRSEGNSTPALVVGGLTSVDGRIEGLKVGCDDYLAKPSIFGS